LLNYYKDTDKEQQQLEQSKLQKAPFEEVKKIYEEQQAKNAEREKLKRKLMLDNGIAVDPYSFNAFADMLNFE
jgi:hypothetical protein